jgi:predicted amidophosphoribosyltransferase
MPQRRKYQCQVCQRPTEEHTGDLCVICGRPVEHHQDVETMELEIAGAARMAEAAEAVGKSPREWELWCIRHVDDRKAAAA